MGFLLSLPLPPYNNSYCHSEGAQCPKNPIESDYRIRIDIKPVLKDIDKLHGILPPHLIVGLTFGQGNQMWGQDDRIVRRS